WRDRGAASACLREADRSPADIAWCARGQTQFGFNFFRATGESNCLSSSQGRMRVCLPRDHRPTGRSILDQLIAERTLGRSPAGPGSVQRTLPHGDDVMKANGGLSRDPAMLGTSGYALRPNGQYFTPTWVTEALLSRVGFRGVIWEPAAGAGDMVKPLRVAGCRGVCREVP